MRKTIFSFVLFVGSAGAGFAADLPASKETPALAVEAPFSWAGFYLGVQGGGDFGRQTGIWGDAKREGLSPYVNNPRGGLIGGHIGYNLQISRVVFGVEADFNQALGVSSATTTVYNALGLNGNPVGTTPYQIGVRETNNETIRLRLGYSIDHALLYATGGVAFGDVTTNYSLLSSSPYLWMTTQRTGWTVGGGLEYAFTNAIHGRVEYRYTDLGTESFVQTSKGGSGNYDNIGLQSNAVLVGLTYHFGGTAIPVAAAY